jgi:hypothetical protein
MLISPPNEGGSGFEWRIESMGPFSLNVLYSQIAIFDGAIERPFSMWTDRHVNQGFAWRKGSVSFATIASGGCHCVDVELRSENAAPSAEALRIIEVPFEVPPSGAIRIASIADEVSLELPGGSYSLRFECFAVGSDAEPRIKLVFAPKADPEFRIVLADEEISASGDLLVEAEPA